MTMQELTLHTDSIHVMTREMTRGPEGEAGLVELQDPFQEALLCGDRREASRIVREAADRGLPLIVVYQETLLSALYVVGELWAANRISVAVEPMSTAITEGILNELYPLIGPVTSRVR